MSRVIEKMICDSPNLVLATLFLLSVLLNFVLIVSKIRRTGETLLLKNIVQHRKAIWYLTLLLVSFTYTILKWDKVSIFYPFSGESLVFVVFAVLSFLPFTESLQIFSFSANIGSIFISSIDKTYEHYSGDAES